MPQYLYFALVAFLAVASASPLVKNDIVSPSAECTNPNDTDHHLVWWDCGIPTDTVRYLNYEMVHTSDNSTDYPFDLTKGLTLITTKRNDGPLQEKLVVNASFSRHADFFGECGWQGVPLLDLACVALS